MGRERSETGISGLGTILSMAGLLAVLLIVAIVVSLTLPSNPTTNTNATATTAGTTPAVGTNQATSTTTSAATTTTVLSTTPSASVVAACQSDLQALQTALAAYQATSGSNATPPAPWSAASYASNFDPLTKAQPPGPYMRGPLVDTHYVILFDASGHVWVESPGNFGAYNPANDAGSTSVCSRMAR